MAFDSDDRVDRERLLRRAVLSGDETAWRTWYDESFETLDRYVLWRCGGLRDRADDVLQETWLIAVRRIRRFNPKRGSFADWLRGIAANVVRNRLRRDRRIHSGTVIHAPAAIGGTAESIAEVRERAERVTIALSKLPEHYEHILRAKYLDSLTVKSIAERLGQSEKAVESLLTRARAAFRDLYLRQEQSDAGPAGGRYRSKADNHESRQPS